jgi:hypothetical protein
MERERMTVIKGEDLQQGWDTFLLAGSKLKFEA